MPNRGHVHLSRRETQIMDIIYRSGQATAAEVQTGLPDPPSYSAVRALLRILVEKGHLRHRQEGPRYVFVPTVPRKAASRSALKRCLDTFFEGSAVKSVAALLDITEDKLTDEEIDRLLALIEAARKGGR